jgi:hypothetical protein
MKSFRELATIAMFSAVALLVVAGAVAVTFLAVEYFSPSELWGLAGAFRTGFYATLLFGVLPGVLLGAPAYWLLRRFQRAARPSVCLVGAALGALVALVEPGLVGWGVGCGIVTAGLTHFAAERWLGPNNSSKPTPLRGAA